ncbi:MAG: hypothetical protein MUP55_01520 [Candidatus Aenigmarchaeota archaeon]|nr:hypothetical protein [Candidatus Aenigmarchaeota archaeon]
MERAEMTSIDEIIKKLARNYKTRASNEGLPTEDELAFYRNRPSIASYAQAMWVPQTQNYGEMLRRLRPGDVVCDMGAGDLRFALLASQKCRKVYAVEFNPTIIADALRIIGYDIPRNMVVICGDWKDVVVPSDITVVTCLVNGAGVIPRWKNCKRRVYLGTVSTDGGKIEKL